MACSDSYAQMLEDTDPDFKYRNAYNRKATNLLASNVGLLCEWGIAAFEGKDFKPHPLERMKVNIDNHYLQQDFRLSQDFGISGTGRIDDINEAADAADSLIAWKQGGDGRKAFEWLLKHWHMDFIMLDRQINKHTLQSEQLKSAGKQQSERYLKRQKLLANDIPKAEEIRKRLLWAKSQLDNIKQ